eukprot:jgi/Tetstr1/420894/TSEL_011957.t1
MASALLRAPASTVHATSSGPRSRSTASSSLSHRRPAVAGRAVRVAAKPSETEKHFEFREDVGECDLADVKDALDACAGLEGQELEDCWASFNCNVEKVTNHYAKVAGVEPKLKKEADADKANGAE